jgi:putative transposase
VAEAIIRKTCKELDIEVIDMAVNSDHVHLYIKYPLKYSVSFIAKRIKGRNSKVLRKEFPHLKGMVQGSSLGTILLSWKCWTYLKLFLKNQKFRTQPKQNNSKFYI